MIVQLFFMQIEKTIYIEESTELKLILDKYSYVFQKLPAKLPLERGMEHIIELEKRTTPIMIKPYRHPHHQKNEIERLVKEFWT